MIKQSAIGRSDERPLSASPTRIPTALPELLLQRVASLGLQHGQLDDHQRADVLDALEVQLAGVGVDQLLRNAQPKTGPAVFPVQENSGPCMVREGLVTT